MRSMIYPSEKKGFPNDVNTSEEACSSWEVEEIGYTFEEVKREVEKSNKMYSGYQKILEKFCFISGMIQHFVL